MISFLGEGLSLCPVWELMLCALPHPRSLPVVAGLEVGTSSCSVAWLQQERALHCLERDSWLRATDSREQALWRQFTLGFP